MHNHKSRDEKESGGKSLSLHPLTPEQALFAVMNTKPKAKKSASKKQKKAP